MAGIPLGLKAYLELVEGHQTWNVTRSSIFDESLKANLRIFPDLAQKLAKFLDVKSENPLRNRYGKHDGPFTGPLAGFLHCHLRDDAILIYTLKNRCINLIYICSHAEIEGKRMKNMRGRLSAFTEGMRGWMNLVEGVISQWDGSGPLFHGTDVLSLAGIIVSDKITASIDDRSPANHGVSLTPTALNAWGFADRSADIFDIEHNHRDLNLGRSPKRGAIIELDSAKLRQHWKLVNYVDHLTFGDDEDGDEDEVRCLGVIAPLSQFLISFSFDPKDVSWFESFLRTDYANNPSGFGRGSQMLDQLHALTRHPKFRPA